jgi:large subunit ribosomal protein L30
MADKTQKTPASKTAAPKAATPKAAASKEAAPKAPKAPKAPGPKKVARAIIQAPVSKTAPAPKKAAPPTSNKKFVVTQLKSLIACTKSQRATMEAINLRGIGKSVTMSDNAANRGQIMKVQHLVDVKVQG